MEEKLGPGYYSGSYEKVRQVLLVSPDLIPQVWPQVEPLFNERPEQWEQFFTLDSLGALLHAGDVQLWTMNDKDEFLLALITELVYYPVNNVLHLMFFAGSEAADAFTFLDTLEMWAHKQGASKVLGVGVPAMYRMLRRYGYETDKVFFHKDISRMREH